MPDTLTPEQIAGWIAEASKIEAGRAPYRSGMVNARDCFWFTPDGDMNEEWVGATHFCPLPAPPTDTGRE